MLNLFVAGGNHKGWIIFTLFLWILYSFCFLFSYTVSIYFLYLKGERERKPITVLTAVQWVGLPSPIPSFI